MTKTERLGYERKMLGVGTHISSIPRRKLVVSRPEHIESKLCLSRNLTRLAMLR